MQKVTIDTELKDFLDEKVAEYNCVNFIEDDPISIPHTFSLKEDIEISGFLAATIAWGNRKSIIKNANRMVGLMGYSPFDFVMNANSKQLSKLNSFVHRTFNGEDFKFFVTSLRNIYTNHGGLEKIISNNSTPESTQMGISALKKYFSPLAIKKELKNM